MIVAIILAVVIVGLDQLTKYLLYGMSCSLIGDFLWLESTLNTGASFGMFKDGTLFFIILTVPMVAVMLYCIISKKHNFSKLLKCSIGVILGGTIGNFIDRIIFAGVRDFIYFKSINFAIFNVADIAITVGVCLLVLSIILEFISEVKKSKQRDNDFGDLDRSTIDATEKNNMQDNKNITQEETPSNQEPNLRTSGNTKDKKGKGEN